MPRVKTTATPPEGILAVALTFSIVEALAKNKVALGVTELSNIVDATKSRIHRHLVTLVQAGYVAQDAQTEKYRIGPRMVSLAQNITTGVEVVATARPILAQLRDDFSHTVVLARLEGDSIRILDVSLGTSDYAILQRAGNTLPRDMLHCSALGKVALAFGPAELLRGVLSGPLARKTPHTLDNARALRNDLNQVRNRGWASVPDEGIVGFNAVASPIFDAKDGLAAMIGIVGATRVLPAKLSSHITAGVRRAGAAVSEALGAGVQRSKF